MTFLKLRLENNIPIGWGPLWTAWQGNETYEGDEGPWGLRQQTRKQTFTDSGVTPGQYYEYKVRAVATTNTSGFSNSAVVYGL